MRVDWIKGEINPPEAGEYYTICEAKGDFPGFEYKKGDIEISGDYYYADIGWASIGNDNPCWKVVAWADVLKPDIPDGIADRVVSYFGRRTKPRDDSNN